MGATSGTGTGLRTQRRRILHEKIRRAEALRGRALAEGNRSLVAPRQAMTARAARALAALDRGEDDTPRQF